MVTSGTDCKQCGARNILRRADRAGAVTVCDACGWRLKEYRSGRKRQSKGIGFVYITMANGCGSAFRIPNSYYPLLVKALVADVRAKVESGEYDAARTYVTVVCRECGRPVEKVGKMFTHDGLLIE